MSNAKISILYIIELFYIWIKGISKIITIINKKNKVDKTTTSTDLSTAFTTIGKSILLVDLDHRRNVSYVT
ncbi:MAG: AAA family ATPase [Wolbachia sp.]